MLRYNQYKFQLSQLIFYVFIFCVLINKCFELLIQKHSAAADITESLSEDQVPEAFLVMLLIQFSTMIVDRALYLRKTLLGKCVFQVVLVFGIHFWMFFILPGVTERWGINEGLPKLLKLKTDMTKRLWQHVFLHYFNSSKRVKQFSNLIYV